MVVNRRCSVTKRGVWDSDRSALQTLHKVSSKAREENYFQGGLTHDWVNYYEQRIESDRSCLNEWHAMDNLESRRPPSPDSVRSKPRQRDETERVIRSTLKEIMMSVDLDEVTSKYIRSRLEEDLDMDLGEFKSFIDQEMLTILGQMDAPTEIFDHVYLGSEWNASNYEELRKNGVGHILNVTREIDNFFPGTFDYLNIRVYDDEKTDLLKYWDNTFKYITKARKAGSKVLVHCKMGVSRSASVVIAYAMKAYNWNFQKAMQHVKEKRNCIKPNTSFLAQLETYEGILDAMKNKEKLQRSKSETNLKSPGIVAKNERVLAGSEPTPAIQALMRSLQTSMSGQDLRQLGVRPKSWSPDNPSSTSFLSEPASPAAFLSLEELNERTVAKQLLRSTRRPRSTKKSVVTKDSLARNVLLPCDNGESYSVSPNQIVHLPGQSQMSDEQTSVTVKHRVNELESLKIDKKKLALNITVQVDRTDPPNPTSPDSEDSNGSTNSLPDEAAQNKLTPPMLTAVLVKKEIWDPGEEQPSKVSYCNGTIESTCDPQVAASDNQTVWTSSAVLQTVPETLNSAVPFSNSASKVPELLQNRVYSGRSKTLPIIRDGDPFSNQLDRVFDREERKQQRISAVPPMPASVTELSNEDMSRDCPSRQSSWSSYDSAVVLGYQGETREAPSRQSSLGSGDTRTLPSRNSSWGSYDMRPGGPVHYINEKGEKVLHPSSVDIFGSSSSGMFPYDKEDIPWYPGTVKRTKQKLEECTGKKTFPDLKDDGDSLVLNDGSLANSTISLENAYFKSPSSETLHSDYPTSVISENEGSVEAFNPAILQCHTTLDSQNTLANKDQLPVDTGASESDISSAISPQIDIITGRQKSSKLASGSRLSVSAPENSSMELVTHNCSLSRSTSNMSSLSKLTSSPNVINTAQCSSVKQHKTFLENLNRDSGCTLKKSNTLDEPQEYDQNTNSSGIVQSLKKEFEAKTGTSNVESANSDNTKHKNRVNSLPTSPVSVHAEKEKCDLSPTSSDPGEDLNFKKLIGKFEINSKEKGCQEAQVVLRPKIVSANKSYQQNKNSRYSCFEVSVEKSPVRITQTPLISNYNCAVTDKSDLKKPPVAPVVRNTAPSVVVATVIAKAAKKQQQFGKSHPLARLNIKPRHNNPVYNTM